MKSRRSSSELHHPISFDLTLVIMVVSIYDSLLNPSIMLILHLCTAHLIFASGKRCTSLCSLCTWETDVAEVRHFSKVTSYMTSDCGCLRCSHIFTVHSASSQPHFPACLPLLGNWRFQRFAQPVSRLGVGVRGPGFQLRTQSKVGQQPGIQARGGHAGCVCVSAMPRPHPLVQSERSAAEILQDWASTFGW